MRTLLLSRLALTVGVMMLLVNLTKAGINIQHELNRKTNNYYGRKEREQVTASLEKSLLSLLGFNKRPKPTAKVHVPESMWEMYRQQTSMNMANIARRGLHARSANTVRSFNHIESPIDEKFQSPHRFRLSFDTVSIPKTESLKASELRLSRLALAEPADKSKARILVHDIVRPGVKGRRKPLLRLIDSKSIDTRYNSTISLDVQPAVSRWLVEPKENHGVLIQVTGLGEQKEPHIRLKRNAEESHENWSSMRPILYTYTDDGRNKMASANGIMERRARRAAIDTNRRRNKRENCRRYPLYVDFVDVGWNDWIVAPPGYDAFYCHGDCPYGLDHLNSTNHAIIQNLVYSTNPSLVPKACCVPTALSSISMLYLDEENKVVLKNYQDMAVIGCGCR